MKSIILDNGISVNMTINGCGSYRIAMTRLVDNAEVSTITNESPVWDYMENDDVWDEESEQKHNEAVAYLERLAESKFEQYDIDQYGLH